MVTARGAIFPPGNTSTRSRAISSIRSRAGAPVAYVRLTGIVEDDLAPMVNDDQAVHAAEASRAYRHADAVRSCAGFGVLPASLYRYTGGVAGKAGAWRPPRRDEKDGGHAGVWLASDQRWSWSVLVNVLWDGCRGSSVISRALPLRTARTLMTGVAANAARAGCGPPVVAITLTRRPTRSAAIVGGRSYCPSVQRYSTVRFLAFDVTGLAQAAAERSHEWGLHSADRGLR